MRAHALGMKVVVQLLGWAWGFRMAACLRHRSIKVIPSLVRSHSLALKAWGVVVACSDVDDGTLAVIPTVSFLELGLLFS